MSAAGQKLSETVHVHVRFSEVDPVRIVWHGNYVKYLEDARESFCRRFGLGYRLMEQNGYYAPVYDLRLRFLSAATVDDELIVTAIWRPCRGAKLCFDYEIRRPSDGTLLLEASSIQLFTTLDGRFEPSEPDFYTRWKEEHAR